MVLRASGMDIPEFENCLELLVNARWNGQPICPYCGSSRTTRVGQRLRCYACNTSFSPTVGTIFHHSHLPLAKWFRAIALLEEDKTMTGMRLSRELGINKNTACRIRLTLGQAMAKPDQRKLNQSQGGNYILQRWQRRGSFHHQCFGGRYSNIKG